MTRFDLLIVGAGPAGSFAAELLASLDGPAEPDAEPAWAAEIVRRIAAIDAGQTHLEQWDRVKRRIENEILGR